MSNEDDDRQDDAPITQRSFRGDDLPEPPASPPKAPSIEIQEEVDLKSVIYSHPSSSGEGKPLSVRGLVPVSQPAPMVGSDSPENNISTALDLLTERILSTGIDLPIRPRQLGKYRYVHPGSDKDGIYVLKGTKDPRARGVLETLQEAILFSPLHYGEAFITGDVGEIRNVKINGDMKEVLVIPQGRMRAEANSAHFKALGMLHPLSDQEKMLEVMALTMYYSGIKTPYFRGFGFADQGNDMAMGEEEFSTTFGAVTWDFFGLPGYLIQEKLKLPPVKLVASPHPCYGHPISQCKVTSTYQPRIQDRRTLLSAPRARELGYSRKNGGDMLYFLPNGKLGDATCYNTFSLICRDDVVTFDFTGVSLGNNVFLGKTDKTIFNLITALQPEGITAIRTHSPEEYAKESKHENKKRLSGRDLTYEILRDNTDGVVIAGTFQGIRFCESILPEEGNPITFPWKTKKAVETIQDLLWNTIYGLNGGTKLTQDQHYCCMFDVTDLQKGIAKPLDLKGATLEDYIE